MQTNIIMAQQNYNIIETDYDLKNFELIRKELLDYEYFNQNLVTQRTCTKNKYKNEFRVKSENNNKFVLVFDNESDTMEVVNSNQNIDVGGLLEPISKKNWKK